jgi:hypothetical protein
MHRRVGPTKALNLCRNGLFHNSVKPAPMLGSPNQTRNTITPAEQRAKVAMCVTAAGYASLVDRTSNRRLRACAHS